VRHLGSGGANLHPALWLPSLHGRLRGKDLQQDKNAGLRFSRGGLGLDKQGGQELRDEADEEQAGSKTHRSASHRAPLDSELDGDVLHRRRRIGAGRRLRPTEELQTHEEAQAGNSAYLRGPERLRGVQGKQGCLSGHRQRQLWLHRPG